MNELNGILFSSSFMTRELHWPYPREAVLLVMLGSIPIPICSYWGYLKTINCDSLNV